MPEQLNIHQFNTLYSANNNLIDVRSPKEFEQGHIPGAINIPLFNNEERAIVGTLYKQQGRQQAILKGLEIVGPKMASIVESAQNIAKNNVVFVYCWRGGMRSGSVAWLLETYGLKVYLLKGGYKTFRKAVLDSFAQQLKYIILGGKTGSGKTLILQKLKEKGEQIIDLEGIAHHKGSAFGALGEKAAPSQEQFENKIYAEILQLDPSKHIWLEDESRLIGNKVIPDGLWQQMTNAKVIHINLPFNDRLEYLVKEYGKYSVEQLKESILKITKRLGPEQTKISLEALDKNDLRTACQMCLTYYDKTYSHGLSKREKRSVEELNCEVLHPDKIAQSLTELTKSTLK